MSQFIKKNLDDIEDYERIKRFENEEELKDLMKSGWGHGNYYITDEDIEHLKSGGYLGFHDGEYTNGIIYIGGEQS